MTALYFFLYMIIFSVHSMHHMYNVTVIRMEVNCANNIMS